MSESNLSSVPGDGSVSAGTRADDVCASAGCPAPAISPAGVGIVIASPTGVGIVAANAASRFAPSAAPSFGHTSVPVGYSVWQTAQIGTRSRAYQDPGPVPPGCLSGPRRDGQA